MQTRLPWTLYRRGVLALMLLAMLSGPAAAQLPRAQANDNRVAAGRMIDGELHVQLEAVVGEWLPRGEDGPVIEAALFAEAGGPPVAPGPMIRVTAGTPVRVTLRNTLGRPMRVRGLGERSGEPPPGANPNLPRWLQTTGVVIAPGESHEFRFTPSEPVTSVYTANVLGPAAGRPDGAVFHGVFIVDAADEPAHADERVFFISASGAEGGNPSVKVFLNGLSWPFTERVSYTVGDTVRWRVINLSGVQHPMHLHGFFFTIDGGGDLGADTIYAPADRQLAVTTLMSEISSVRLTWVPVEAGNWLFHCHLIRHMGEPQLFNIDRERRTAAGHDHAEHDMAGLVLGITVRPRPGHVETDPEQRRRIDLWTGSRPGVHGDRPELGFVVQDGAVPAPDSTRVPGSTLILRQGEPTRIVVHNRLHFPLAVHWHGLELRSLYDGVGHWSGHPGATRPPIPPGDSAAVLITPPRAGTFMYHTHGEPAHELAQGLYGGFLVLPSGEALDTRRDRLFMLAARGAVIDAPPAINGFEQPPHEHFTPGETVRLRFAHISADELKTVRLLRAGEPVHWRLRARDGADLPAHLRTDVPAHFDIGVGETRDFEWTPGEPGVYVLEVRTTWYPQRGGTQLQRVAFGVGDVTAAALTAAVLGTDLPVAYLTPEAVRRYAGLFAVADADTPAAVTRIRFSEVDGRLFADDTTAGGATTGWPYMIPVGDHAFAYGSFAEGVIVGVHPGRRVRFIADDDAFTAVEIIEGDDVVATLGRVPDVVLTEADFDRLVGEWAPPGAPFVFRTERDVADLVLIDPNGQRSALSTLSATQFAPGGMPPGSTIEFVLEDDRAVAFIWSEPGRPPFRVDRKQ
jgi:manganese oxidase